MTIYYNRAIRGSNSVDSMKKAVMASLHLLQMTGLFFYRWQACFSNDDRPVFLPMTGLFFYRWQACFSTDDRPVFLPMTGLFFYRWQACFSTDDRPVFLPMTGLFFYRWQACFSTDDRPVFLPMTGLFFYRWQACFSTDDRPVFLQMTGLAMNSAPQEWTPGAFFKKHSPSIKCQGHTTSWSTLPSTRKSLLLTWCQSTSGFQKINCWAGVCLARHKMQMNVCTAWFGLAVPRTILHPASVSSLPSPLLPESLILELLLPRTQLISLALKLATIWRDWEQPGCKGECRTASSTWRTGGTREGTKWGLPSWSVSKSFLCWRVDLLMLQASFEVWEGFFMLWGTCTCCTEGIVCFFFE